VEAKMKKMIVLFFVAVASVTFTMASLGTGVAHAAAFTCSSMQVVQVGLNNAWFKNVSGAACGAVANNSNVYFKFNPGTNDRILAVVLTASTATKTLWVHAAGDTSGSIVDIVSMKN